MQIFGQKNHSILAKFGTKWYLVRKGMIWHSLVREKAVSLRSKT